MNELVEKYLSSLKKKSFIELAQLEDYHGEKVIKNRKSYTISVWKTEINSDELRVVVQIYHYCFLSIGKIDADWFTINREGKISDLTRTELYEFI